MAILNWIQTGTYSTIKLSQYDKHKQVLNIEVDTFADSTKKYLLQSTNFSASVQEYKQLLSKQWQAPPSDDYEDYDSFFVNGQGQGLWSSYDNKVVSWFNDHWELGTQPFDGQIVHIVDENLFYLFNEGTSTWTLINQNIPITSDKWEILFGLSAQDQEGNNMLKLAYSYLHALPQFANTTPG